MNEDGRCTHGHLSQVASEHTCDVMGCVRLVSPVERFAILEEKRRVVSLSYVPQRQIAVQVAGA